MDSQSCADRSGPVVAPAVHTQLASVLPAASMSGFTMALSCVARGALSMIRYYGRLMMGLLMDESARRSYDADREDLRGRLPRNRHCRCCSKSTWSLRQYHKSRHRPSPPGRKPWHRRKLRSPAHSTRRCSRPGASRRRGRSRKDGSTSLTARAQNAISARSDGLVSNQLQRMNDADSWPTYAYGNWAP